MAEFGRDLCAVPTAEVVDQALAAFWPGRPDEFDRLVGDTREEGPHVCRLLFSAFQNWQTSWATGAASRDGE